MSMTPCLWCGDPFAPRSTGGSRQRFCRTSCRREFHDACRRWAEAEVLEGRLTVETIRSPQTQRSRWYNAHTGESHPSDGPTYPPEQDGPSTPLVTAPRPEAA